MSSTGTSNGTIEIIVAPDGSTRLQTHGFSGSTCRDASRFVEEALGRRRGEMLTAEFHQSTEATRSIHCGHNGQTNHGDSGIR